MDRFVCVPVMPNKDSTEVIGYAWGLWFEDIQEFTTLHVSNDEVSNAFGGSNYLYETEQERMFDPGDDTPDEVWAKLALYRMGIEE